VSPTPKFLIDRNHKVVFWNRSLEIMTKLRAEDIMGTSLHWKAFYPEPRPCLVDLLLDGEAPRQGDLPGKKPPASPYPGDCCESTQFFPSIGPSGKWLRCTATVIRDSHGNLTGAMETFEDVTDVKHREFRVDQGT
jgi:PAS domain-containing protein